ncbi:hypothetical protein BgiMline_001627 [Biomphalaria glabrata]|nr:hypothetical protein BgiMline_001512 [Biomphalaria glabrata]
MFGHAWLTLPVVKVYSDTRLPHLHKTPCLTYCTSATLHLLLVGLIHHHRPMPGEPVNWLPLLKGSRGALDLALKIRGTQGVKRHCRFNIKVFQGRQRPQAKYVK